MDSLQKVLDFYRQIVNEGDMSYRQINLTMSKLYNKFALANLIYICLGKRVICIKSAFFPRLLPQNPSTGCEL